MLKLLLVEDDPEKLRAICDAAEGDGREILEAVDLEGALRILGENEIDLVVTDLALRSLGQDADGLELIRAAKAKEENLPVILISSYLQVRSSNEALDAGAFDIIDRASSVYDPDEMLRLKINLALRYRMAMRQANLANSEGQ